jgi:MFS family permease
MAFERNVVLLGVASFLTDVASEMCFPVLPVLMASVGGGPAMLGLMEGTADAVSALLKLISGRLSDRWRRRKPLVLAGYLLAALARPLNVYAGSAVQMVLIRTVDRVGKGLRTAPRDALLAEAVEPHARGAAFGFHRAMDHAGAVLGPLIAAGFLAASPNAAQVRTLFALSLVPALLAVMVIAVGVCETAHVTRSPTAPAQAGRVRPGARGLLGVTAFFSALRIQEVLLLSMLAQLGVPPPLLPLAWSAMHVVKSLSATPLGRLADQVGHGPALVAGYLLYAVTLALVGLAPTAPFMLMAMLVYALHHGLTEGVEKALVSLWWPSTQRGAGFGSYHAVVAMAAMPSGWLQGVVLAGSGSATLCLGLSMGAGVCAAVMAAWVWRFARHP